MNKKNRDSTGTGAWLGQAARRYALLALTLTLAGATLAGCVSTNAPTNGQSRAENNADAASINVQLGLDYLQKGDLVLAQTKLQRALTENSHSADVHSSLALLDERLGDSKGADREYRRALALSQRSPQMLNAYGVYLCSHGRPAEGVRDFEEAAANPIYSTPWAAYTNAGICLRDVHQDVQAMQRFTRALQSNPAFADAAFEAASLEYSEQHFVAARLGIEVFLMSNPPSPSLLLLGWQIARTQGDPVGQDRYAHLLGRDFPDSPQAHALVLARRSGSG